MTGRQTLAAALAGVLALVAVIAVIAVAVQADKQKETEQMKACVAAGKEWVRDYGSYYECVEEGGR